MRFPPCLSVALLLLVAVAHAAEESLVDEAVRQRRVEAQIRRDGAPKLDPQRIINESSGFLKEREPEMTAEEYALYQRVVTMLTAKPAFALKLLSAMVSEDDPPSPAFEFILGNVYYSSGDTAQAEGSYRRAVERYPTFLRAWSNLGVIYYTTGRYPDAVRCFSKCVTLGDRDAMTFGLLGYSLEQEKKIIPAEMAYMQALAGDPANTDWLEGLLRLYVQGKQHGRAEWLVKDLVARKPDDPRYWLAYANILLAQGRKLEAIAVLETTLGTGIAGAQEIGLLADLYADQQLVPEAIATYQKVRETTPDLGEKKLITLASLLAYRGDFKGAWGALDSLKGKVSDSGRGAWMLARAEAYVAQDRWTEAHQELDRLLQLEPLNGRALIQLGKVHLAEGSLGRAQLTFEAALQAADSVYPACLELATLQLRLRHFDKTVEYLERALAIQKTGPVQDFLARVKPLVASSASVTTAAP
jgi:tetratricopeptide (TPR) repeat protein